MIFLIISRSLINSFYMHIFIYDVYIYTVVMNRLTSYLYMSLPKFMTEPV